MTTNNAQNDKEISKHTVFTWSGNYHGHEPVITDEQRIKWAKDIALCIDEIIFCKLANQYASNKV